MNKEIGIYIHIPFCISKCHYCNFVSYTNKDTMIESYINCVCEELLKNSELLSQYSIKTVYFGGGTPSYIDSKYIAKIMNVIHLFSIDIEEVTIEINPESASIDKLLTYKNSGINRVSIGLQSTHDDVLKSIGRPHDLSTFEQTLSLCKDVGISNVSVDLIYPLPGLTLDRFKETLEYVTNLKTKYSVNHVSIYNLEVHENSKLDFLLKEGYLSLADEDEEYEMRQNLDNILSKSGYNKYEISNYAIPGYESKHNLNYWNQEEYLGIGASASSFLSGTRYKNIDDIKAYIEHITNSLSIIDEAVDLDKLELMKEYIILRLRLKDGVNIKSFKKRFSKDIFDIFAQELKELEKNGLIVINKKDSCIYLSSRGQEVANLVWEKFI